jgi:virulence factor Mce-like protein
MSALAASPTMVGAVTVLIITVAVFLAYNANSGLPFVPTYNISAQVPNANTLVPGNEVRIGGVRVGLVEAIEPVVQEDGTAVAKLDLKLDQDANPIPVDSTMIVRSRSALGLKYLEISKGTSTEGFAQGAVVPLDAARPEPVEIDEFLNTFDEPTQVAIHENLVEFGNALAGRGIDLNAALGDLDSLLPPLESVTRNLGDPDTQLGRFVTALAATAAEVAPVAEQQARMFASLDTTFTALAGVSRPFIQETISESPPTLDQGIQSLPAIRPFLDHSAALFADLRPGAAALATTSPAIADALEAGPAALDDAEAFNDELPPTSESLFAFSQDPGVNAGIARLNETADSLSPALRFITPAQSVCNYASLLARNASSAFDLGDGLGTWQRFTVFDPADGPNNEGSPSSAPASGPDVLNYSHINPYPNTASPGQTFECEAGNEGYIAGQQVIGNVPGNQGLLTEEQLPGMLKRR